MADTVWFQIVVLFDGFFRYSLRAGFLRGVISYKPFT